MRTPRGWRLAAVAVSLAAAVAGCQATTQETSTDDNRTDDNRTDYPDTARSPGFDSSTISLGTQGTSKEDSRIWQSYGPVYRAVEELIADVNADGGILGRDVVQVPIYDFVRGDETTNEDVYQAYCTHAVTERPTFAFSAISDNIPLLEQSGCIGPERTINLLRANVINAEDLEDAPDVVAPYAMDDVTAAHTLVDRLDAQGFFDGAQQVAVFSPGTFYAESAQNIVAAKIEELGYPEPLVITTDDATEAAANSIALQLKTEGVDRVVWFSGADKGFKTLTAMVAQQFTPRLGVSNNVNPETFIQYANYPASQVYVVSTLGSFVLGSGDEFASIPDTPASERCEEALRATGLKLDGILPLLASCDVVSLTREALEASGAEEPSTAAFFDGLAELTEFDSAFGVTLDFSHGRTGISQVWNLHGDDACGCLKVTSGPNPVTRG